MTDNVVSLYGGEIKSPEEASAEVISVLEYALERAKSGSLIAVGIAGVQSDGSCGSYVAIDAAPYAAVAAASLLLARMHEEFE